MRKSEVSGYAQRGRGQRKGEGETLLVVRGRIKGLMGALGRWEKWNWIIDAGGSTLSLQSREVFFKADSMSSIHLGIAHWSY